MTQLKDLIGKTLVSVDNYNDELIFTTDDNRQFKLYHDQDCCETVTIEDICGDLSDLVGSPILQADEEESRQNPPDAKPETIEYQDSYTWSFYKFATVKGSVTVRWYGSSNGYYSESVSFAEVSK